MKTRLHTTLFLSLLALMFSNSATKACNLSDLTFVSLTGTGPYVITVRLCVGMGLTGSTKGGDQSTNSVFFGFYDAAPPGFTVLSYAPANMVGPMGCSMPGLNFGPDPSLGTQGEIIYIDPGYYGFDPICTPSPYGCVNSTLLCGPAQAFCRNFTFTVNQIPDSMRVFGVEGGGNPVGGCYPNADMKVTFAVLPIVWGDVEGLAAAAGVRLKWNTLREINSDYFTVERAGEDNSFENLGQLPATGNSDQNVEYAFFDPAPLNGVNRYRINQVDRAGVSSDSKTIEVVYTSPNAMRWSEVGPNPAIDKVNVSFYSPNTEVIAFQLRDVNGKLALELPISATAGGNSLQLDLSKLNTGIYYMSLMTSDAKLVKKIVKL